LNFVDANVSLHASVLRLRTNIEPSNLKVTLDGRSENVAALFRSRRYILPLLDGETTYRALKRRYDIKGATFRHRDQLSPDAERNVSALRNVGEESEEGTNDVEARHSRERVRVGKHIFSS